MSAEAEHLYILTLEAAGGRLATWSGTIRVRPGATRQGVLLDLKAQIEDHQPALRDAAIVFFSLEPNSL